MLVMAATPMTMPIIVRQLRTGSSDSEEPASRA